MISGFFSGHLPATSFALHPAVLLLKKAYYGPTSYNINLAPEGTGRILFAFFFSLVTFGTNAYFTGFFACRYP